MGNLLVVDDETSYLIEKAKYDLKAIVEIGVATGTIKIGGTNDGEKFTLKADLLGNWNASGDGTLWDFNTTNIVCSDLINTLTGGCTTANVVFLNLPEAIGPETGIDKISTAGLSLRKFTPGQGYTTGEFFKRCNRVASRTV